MRIRCDALVLPDRIERGITIDLDSEGRITAIDRAGADSRADLVFRTALPGFANTHSHAFHRLLRGRTNSGEGDFWEWRTRMYAAARLLEPSDVFEVARFVYTEMRAAGYTAVGEFHYLHHRPGGSAYPAHDMETAIAEGARAAGIRLTLLDTCYLAGGFGRPLAEEQMRFGDGSADGWLTRWHRLREHLADHYPEVALGAAIHSVRAVPPAELVTAVAGLPTQVPLHLHLSEQPAENRDCREFTGMTPTELVAASGALSARTTVVHATHLTPEDVRILGDASVSVSLCPTTEADLGDGLGVPRELHDAGARLTIGSDQNVIIDPFAEIRGVESMGRLSSHRRGVFRAGELWRLGTANGHASLEDAGAPQHELAVGCSMDLVEIDARSARNLGAHEEELMFSSSAADVIGTVVRGQYRRAGRGEPPNPEIWERLERER